MPRGCQTSTDIQWTVIWLSRFLDHERIAMSVDLSICLVRCIILHFRDYGTIPNPENDLDTAPKEREKCQHLRDVDVEFLLGTIEKAPDLYLDELPEMLAASCGRTVLKSTIWRTLRKTGFTMKKVKNLIHSVSSLFLLILDYPYCR
ncbi:hypothetical protein PAXRUDRAFT_141690 [Paxillus rubicundulus Ve08.2h10]|uniref:Winged helix-turn helix domain-containing protein n=1 Tax=Paxillus rubicundulus Ve08.2h10 TaxID=930991 RepID=A0A0D0DCR1_9AGAM|nr:hypothetical protein PAXRUDRAFT_141690 [Paxillus rubicundulus Ve08.2h10]